MLLYVAFGSKLIPVGTDLREFFLDGGDANGSNKIIGVDLEPDFIDLGQNLFKGPTKGIEFRNADLLDSTDTTLNDIKGKVNLIYTGALFHLFDEEGQIILAEKIQTLIAIEGEVAVFGLHRGAKVKGPRSIGIKFAHSPESWKELWTQILGDDALNWTMQSELRYSWTAADYVTEDHPILQWSLWRK